MNQDRMAAQLELHEGLRLRVYLDTMGNETLGIGYNVTARGLEEFQRTIGRTINPKANPCITAAEARLQLVADIQRYQRAVVTYLPEFKDLNEVRQRVCVDLAFNLGFKALTFVGTIAAIKSRDWSQAAKHLYRSRWAHQVDDGPGGHFGRADRLAKMLLTGQDYTA